MVLQYMLQLPLTDFFINSFIKNNNSRSYKCTCIKRHMGGYRTNSANFIFSGTGQISTALLKIEFLRKKFSQLSNNVML